jgi:hypothetical protein
MKKPSIRRGQHCERVRQKPEMRKEVSLVSEFCESNKNKFGRLRADSARSWISFSLCNSEHRVCKNNCHQILSSKSHSRIRNARVGGEVGNADESMIKASC